MDIDTVTENKPNTNLIKTRGNITPELSDQNASSNNHSKT